MVTWEYFDSFGWPGQFFVIVRPTTWMNEGAVKYPEHPLHCMIMLIVRIRAVLLLGFSGHLKKADLMHDVPMSSLIIQVQRFSETLAQRVILTGFPPLVPEGEPKGIFNEYEFQLNVSAGERIIQIVQEVPADVF